MGQLPQLHTLHSGRIPAYASLFAFLLVVGGANADGAARNESAKPLVAEQNTGITSTTLPSRLLLVLEGTLRQQKVSEDVLEKAMGIRMRPHPSRPGQTYYPGLIEDGRKYSFVYGPHIGRDTVWVILWEENPPDDSANCLLRFDLLHRKLIEMGFEGARRNTEHEHAPRNGWLYARDGIELYVDYDPRRLVHRGKDLDAKNLCIDNIRIFDRKS